MHEVAELLEVLEARTTRHEPLNMLRSSAPAHRFLGSDEHTEKGNREPSEPVEGPLGSPRAEAPETHRRIELPSPPVGIVTTAHGHEVLEPLSRQPGVHLTSTSGEFGDRSRTALPSGSAAAVGEPRGEFGSERAGALVLRDIRAGSSIRDAVKVDEGSKSEGVGVGERGHDRPAFGMADDNNRSAAGDELEDTGGVAKIGVEGVEVSMVGVAVPTLIPGDDPEARLSESGCEHIEGAAEVGATVDEHQHWIALVAPFVNGDSDTIGIDPVRAGRTDRTGEGSLLDHPGEATTVALVLAPDGCSMTHRNATLLCARLAVVALSVTMVAACGLDAEESLGELPPIRTTTTTSTTTTVPDLNRYFYEVKPGDTLFAIAGYFQVPMAEIVALNGLEDADDIQVGQMLEIPSGLVIVTIPDEIRLGGATTTSSTLDPGTPSTSEG